MDAAEWGFVGVGGLVLGLGVTAVVEDWGGAFGYALIVGGGLMMLAAFVLYPLLVRAVAAGGRLALSRGVLDPPGRAEQVRALRATLVQMDRELSGNRTLIAGAIDSGYFWDNRRYAMFQNEWAQGQRLIASEPGLDPLHRHLASAYAQSFRAAAQEKDAHQRVRVRRLGDPEEPLVERDDNLVASLAAIDEGLTALRQVVAELATRQY